MTDLKNVITTISPMKSSLLYLIEDISVILPLLKDHLVAIETLDFSPHPKTIYDLVICSPDNVVTEININPKIHFSDSCTILYIHDFTKTKKSKSDFVPPQQFEECFVTKDVAVYERRRAEWENIKEIAQFCYTHIEPTIDNVKQDGKLILRDGFGLCGSSSRAAKYLAESMGYQAKVATFRMEGLPFGRGEKKWDTHTICEVKLKTDDKWVVCDAMANICYPYSLNELISTPSLADQYLEQIGFVPDARWESRNYKWYSTSLAYSHAVSMKYPKVWYSNIKKHVQSLKRLLTK